MCEHIAKHVTPPVRTWVRSIPSHHNNIKGNGRVGNQKIQKGTNNVHKRLHYSFSPTAFPGQLCFSFSSQVVLVFSRAVSQFLPMKGGQELPSYHPALCTQISSSNGTANQTPRLLPSAIVFCCRHSNSGEENVAAPVITQRVHPLLLFPVPDNKLSQSPMTYCSERK